MLYSFPHYFHFNIVCMHYVYQGHRKENHSGEAQGGERTCTTPQAPQQKTLEVWHTVYSSTCTIMRRM